MKVTIINPDSSLVSKMSLACNTCVKSIPEPSDDIDKIVRVLRAGHLSIAEHISITFLIRNVSRSLMAQLTRHRHGSFSIQSQRSVEPTGIVMPPTIAMSEDAYNIFMQTYIEINKAKGKLIDLGIPLEDVRYLSPEGSTTNILLTFNLRALIEASQKRLCLQAQWEIRELFIEIRDRVTELYGTWLGQFLCPPCDICTDMRSCANRGIK